MTPPTLCYASSPGCSMRWVSTYHWCQLTPGHREAHRCRCGLEFILPADRGDAWEG